MPQLTLNKTQIDAFSAFLRKHDKDKWFLAKDEGAYVGATAGKQEDNTFENILFYFKGMDPSKNDDAWDNARHAFGGDDFGEFFDASIMHDLSDDPLTTKMAIIVTKSSISIKSWAKKAAPKAAPKKAATPPKKPMNKGEQIRQFLADGLPIKAIVKIVGTTENSVRWHKSKMKNA